MKKGKLYRVTNGSYVTLFRSNNPEHKNNCAVTGTHNHNDDVLASFGSGSLVMFIKTDETTNNHLLIFKDCIGWTWWYIDNSNSVFKEVTNVEEG